jgi:hypothetical protein
VESGNDGLDLDGEGDDFGESRRKMIDNKDSYAFSFYVSIFAVAVSGWLSCWVPVLVLSHIRFSGGTLSWQALVGA